ncbi:MAG: hypothetical protein AB7G13_01925 [Lautropia sp.]
MHESEPALPIEPTGAASRLTLCFRRTALGDQQVRRAETGLPLHIARLLLLFEGPQTVDDLRQMIDEPWLPEALIELERRRLIQRVTPPLAPTRNLLASALGTRPGSGSSPLAQRRMRIRLLFLRQIGTLGADMARRIDECRSDAELDELMPQVDALIEALAGRDALGQFREQSARDN